VTADLLMERPTSASGRARNLIHRRGESEAVGLLVRLAGQWIAGEHVQDAVRVAIAANERGVDVVLNYLGEHLRDRETVKAAADEYLGLLDALGGARVRGGVSVKPTQIGLLIDRTLALTNLLAILDISKAAGRRMWLDMEAAPTTDDTLWLYERLFERHPDVGVCLQANLRRTGSDLDRMLDLGGHVRLTKGAYRESEEIAFQDRPSIDRAFLVHLETLFRRGHEFAVASHDGRMIDRAIVLSRTSAARFEFQMLQGVRDPLKEDLVRRGFRVVEYVPYGPTWLPYFSRRLRERPRNVVTMVRSLVQG
jgi:proline dehydrogenase